MKADRGTAKGMTSCVAPEGLGGACSLHKDQYLRTRTAQAWRDFLLTTEAGIPLYLLCVRGGLALCAG
jgi:hypothetical protein